MQTGSKMEPSCSALLLVTGSELQARGQAHSEALAVVDELVISDLDEADAADSCAKLAVVGSGGDGAAAQSIGNDGAPQNVLSDDGIGVEPSTLGAYGDGEGISPPVASAPPCRRYRRRQR